MPTKKEKTHISGWEIGESGCVLTLTGGGGPGCALDADGIDIAAEWWTWCEELFDVDAVVVDADVDVDVGMGIVVVVARIGGSVPPRPSPANPVKDGAGPEERLHKFLKSEDESSAIFFLDVFFLGVEDREDGE